MTINEMIMEKLNTIAEDTTVRVDETEISVTIEDFEGFDEDWSEIYRDLINPEAISEVLAWLRQNADKVDDDFYIDYYFGDIVVHVGYASFNI